MRVRRGGGTEALWRAAAQGAHRNGDHEAERAYRDVVRMMRGRPPLTRLDRCIDGSKRDDQAS